MSLLHLVTQAEWAAALRAGAVAPPSLAEVGFVHLSAAQQVHLPANLLFAGRQDMLLLAVDPAGLDLRWEPGSHGEAMLFPHVYGPVPTTAVLTVSTYRPGPDGAFPTPPQPPDRGDHTARVRTLAAALPLLHPAATPPRDAVVLAGPAVPGSAPGGDLLVQGATAWFTGTPAEQQPLRTAMAQAAAHGCDLLGLAVPPTDRDRWTELGFAAPTR